MSDKEFIKEAKSAIKRKDENELKAMSVNKTKMKKILKEPFGMKKYLQQNNIEEAREMFKTRVKLQPFAGNYSNDRRFARTNWLCRCMGAREEEDHLTSGQCPVYGDLVTEQGDLENDNNLVSLFKEILSRREKMDTEVSEVLLATTFAGASHTGDSVSAV